jgi:beta-carotene 15,15'-dioxygenase
MIYAQSKLFKIQLLIQGLLVTLFYLLNVDQHTQAVFGGVLLCVVGIPHGANDYLYRQDASALGVLKFLLTYVGSMLLYLVLWWVAPAMALVAFFVVSFHHFGQSNFEKPYVWYWPSMLWGIWILLLPVMLHLSEALGIFTDMISFSGLWSTVPHSGNVPSFGIPLWQYIVLITVAALYVVSLIRFERENLYRYLLQFAAVSIWYLVTPLLFGFITVFCLWHASQSLQHQANYFQFSFKKSAMQFAKAMVPFSFLALLGFGLYVYFFEFKISEAFVLLSLISLPHIVVMHRLYAHT